MKKLIVFLSCLVSLLSSCTKLFDKTPQDFLSPENYYETEAQLEYALNGVYSTLAESGVYANFMIGRMGLDGDEGFDHYVHDHYTVSDYTVNASDAFINRYWDQLYEGINRANMLLENIDKPQMDETKRDKIRGQALFLRAYYYLLLVNRFENIPLVLHTAKTASPENVQVPQAPASKVYDKIIEDMEEASTLVDDAATVGMGGRISKSAVWGILARACLYAAGYPVKDASRYEDARKWADMVIKAGVHSLNPSFQQIFINHCQDIYDIKESIWEVEFWGNGSGNYKNSAGYVGRNNGIGSSQDPEIGYSAGMARATGPLFYSYDPSDLRRDWTIAPFAYSGEPAKMKYWSTTQIYSRYCGKWRRIYEKVLPRSTTRTPTNFPILRYSDVLLMFAEADNEVNHGPTPEAYDAINQVRRRGYGKPVDLPDPTVDLSGLDENDFREILQDERSRELAFECLRKSDLVRWGIFLPKMKAVLNDVAGDQTSVGESAIRTFTNASARDVVWPIPSHEMGINKKLVQNPGF